MSKRNKLTVVVACILLCLVTAGGSLAWYLREEQKRAQTEAERVMTPYNLYLMKPNAVDSLQFAVGNLHPGETKQIIICVSNKRPADLGLVDTDMAELARESEFGYDLMLVHTENLAVDYKIYPLKRCNREGELPAEAIILDDDTKDQYYWMKEGSLLQGEDSTAEMRSKAGTEADDINAGACWVSRDETMQLAYHDGTYEFDYYLIEIDWKDTVNDFDQYKKETDMVYVVVNAKQPRPVEKTE